LFPGSIYVSHNDELRRIQLVQISPAMKTLGRSKTHPSLCFVGPLVGRNSGYVTTQGEILSDKFKEVGYSVTSVSASPNRYMRLADIVSTLIQRRKNVDIMILQVYGERSFVVEDIASWLGRQFRQSIVMVLRGGTLPDFFARFPNWARRVLSRAAVLIAPSEFLARAVLPYGFRAQVIPNLIDISVYPYRHRLTVSPRLFWLRGFYPYYNPMMAVRVVSLLRSKVPGATLVMAGQDKGIELDVRRLAGDLGLDGAIRFPGFLDMEGKIREGNTADIFLNTNNIDNMPVAVLEACAMGLPVVATNVGGIPDLLRDNETALLVPDDDAEAMAAAICRLLDEPDLAGRLSANGRQLAECSSWERVSPQWLEVFAQVMGSPMPR
jgi:glycosyltransferase involved in cell wall biosynthesis